MKFSCCIDMMYASLTFEERIAQTARDGADAVEFWKWSNKDIPLVKRLLEENNLKCALCNLDSADETLDAALMRGILSHRRTDELVSAIHESASVMRELGLTKAIVLAGDVDPEIEYERALENTLETLRVGVKAAEEEGIMLVLEPLNTFDRASYVMPYSAPAFEIVREIGSPSLKLLLDLYHTQRMEGNLIDTLTKNIDLIGHFHVANSPRRCEPDLGEVNYKAVFDAIEDCGYSEYIGFEYRQVREDFKLGDYIREVKR